MLNPKKMPRFGMNLRFIRMMNGVSVTKLGDMIGQTYGSIQAYESGHCNPSIEALAKISKALNVRVDWLLNHEFDEKEWTLE